MAVILPWAISMLAILILSARAVNYLFDRPYPAAINMILGFVIASTLAILPLQFASLIEVLWCAVCFIVGFVIAWLMERLGDKIKPKDAGAA